MRAGVRLRLQDQPFKVLAALLKRPGQIVTREELRRLIWPEASFGDFDHAINLAVAKLRAVLGDSADVPHLIETLPRRGYRFIVPIKKLRGDLEGPASIAPSPQTAGGKAHFASAKRLALLASFLCALAIAVILIWLKLRSPLLIPKIVDTAQLTKDGGAKDVTQRLLSDGMRLYFQEGAYAGPESTVAPVFAKRSALLQVSTQGGETAEIPISLTESLAFDISPTRPELLLGGTGSKTGTPFRRELWLMPLPAGPLRRVGNILALDASWSPDGSHVVFVNDRDILIANRDGSEIRKLATAPAIPYWVRLSPGGTRLRFTVFTLSGRPEDWTLTAC